MTEPALTALQCFAAFLVAGLVIGALIVVYMETRAPLGWEDESGYHNGTRTGDTPL